MKQILWFAIIIVLAFLIRYIYQRPKFDKGSYFIDFESTLADGTVFRLEQLRGYYVLIDFWGSWCGPCRAENPGLVQLHRRYNGAKFKEAKGFEIISIALENNQEQWQRAVKADGLVWSYHILETQRLKGPLAKQFGIRQIPTKYLLNPEGQIISVNPDVDEISTFLSEEIQ